MAQIETPNYLGFLAQMPKESGLQSGIEHGIQTYGALQNIRGEKQRQALQEEKLKQEKMTTEDMPGKIDRTRQTEEQAIRKNAQQIAREEKTMPLDLEVLHNSIAEGLKKPAYWQSETEKNQIHSGLMSAQQQEAFANAKKIHMETREKEQMVNILKGLNEGEQVAPQQPGQMPVGNAPQGGADIGTPQQAAGTPVAQGSPGSPPQRQQQLAQQPGGQPVNAPQGQPQQPRMQQQAPAQGISSQFSPREQRMLKVADTLAVLKGQTPPSVELAMKQKSFEMEQQARQRFIYGNAMLEAQSKDMVVSAKVSADRATTAQNSINQLNQFVKFTDSAKIKGPMASYFSSVAKFDPGYVEALKATAQLQMSGIKDLAASKVGRILQMEVDMLSKGIPDPNMTPEAAKEIAKMLKTQSEAVISRNQIFQASKDIVPDASRLSTALDNIALQNNYVDAKGNTHAEAIKDWKKIATPERIYAEAYPEKFEQQFGEGSLEAMRNKSVRDAIPLPQGLTEEGVAHIMNKYGVNRRQAVNDYERAKNK